MGGRTRWLRVRAFASSWFAGLVVALLVCAVAGGYATGVAYAAPATTEERETVEQWAVGGDYSHSATVTRENPVFEVGTELENRPTYFTGVSPVLDGTYTAAYTDTGADSGPLSVSLDAALVVRSTSENQVFWSERTPLAATEDASLDGGGTTAVNFSLNVTRVNERIDEIQSGLGETPGEVETFVAVGVNASGTVDGDPADVSFTRRLSLSPGPASYSVSEPASTPESATTTRVVTVPRTYGPLWTVGGPLLFVAGVLGLGALAVGYRRDALALSDAERDYLAFRDDRAEFDEWVVRARLPEAVLDRERAEAASLSDLVDFAIDADVGVVEDTRTGSFYAVTRDLLVAYDPPEPPGASLSGEGGADGGSEDALAMIPLLGGAESAGDEATDAEVTDDGGDTAGVEATSDVEPPDATDGGGEDRER